jgi:hypothetical protein
MSTSKSIPEALTRAMIAEILAMRNNNDSEIEKACSHANELLLDFAASLAEPNERPGVVRAIHDKTMNILRSLRREELSDMLAGKRPLKLVLSSEHSKTEVVVQDI